MFGQRERNDVPRVDEHNGRTHLTTLHHALARPDHIDHTQADQWRKGFECASSPLRHAVHGPRAERGVFAGTVVVALTLLAAPGSGVLSAPAQTPLVQVTPDELRLSQPLKTIAADRGRVAFAFCNQLLGVWRPGASDVTRLGPPAQWTCPPPRGAERVHSLALSRDRVAWVVEAGGNVVTNLLFLVVLGRPEVLTIAAEF